jgi:BirA family biotin operon repressor/biotin-[acetyl-CoA-carboxylase] ligase
MTSPRLAASHWIDVEELASTQDEARKRLSQSSGALDNVWVRAERQTAGRGRQGRSWLAAEGALLLSTGFRLAHPALAKPLVSLWAGDALYESLRSLGGRMDRAFLKWPNDLVAPLEDGGYAKIGGILAEAFGAQAVVVGWGINTLAVPGSDEFRASSLLRSGLFTTAPAARALGLRLREVLLSKLEEWERESRKAEAALIERLRKEAMAPLWGRAGTLADGQKATALDLESDGALRVRGPRGEQRVLAGEFRF